MKLSEQILAVLVLIFLVIMILSGSQMSMATDGYGNMAPCPFINGGSLCSMNVMQHIGAEQSLFTATTPTNNFLFLVFALLLIGFSLKTFYEDYLAERAVSIFKNNDFDPLVFDPLRLAFRKGILHSKRHNFASIYQ